MKELVYRPEERTERNEAGSFSLTVDERDSGIVITRQLDLTKTGYRPEEWPALRALPPADRHERHRTVLLKAAKSTEEDKDKKDVAKEQTCSLDAVQTMGEQTACGFLIDRADNNATGRKTIRK